MTISVVQSVSFNAASSGSFGANVTAGNSVILWQFAYTNSGAAISTSSPLFGGSAVTGATQLLQKQGASAATVYGTIWLLPNVTGGAASVAITVTNGIIDTNVGMAAAEVSGLGTSPAVDPGAPAVTATGTSANPASGSTAALTEAPEIILAMAIEYGTAITAPGAPFVAPTGGQPSTASAAGWQIATSSGGTFAYNTTSGASQQWVAGIGPVYNASSGPALPQQPPFLYIQRRV